MQAPGRIFFVGANPAGGKLRARFVGDDIPSAVQVKGTSDKQPVRLRCNNRGELVGRWISKDKYPSRRQTLQFIKDGQVVLEAKYDACGDVVIDQPKAILSPTSTITKEGNTVNFVWTSTTEEALDQYVSEKKLSTATAWEAFDADEAEGVGTTYTATDTPSASGTYDYRLMAAFLDGSVSAQPLLTASIQISINNPESVIESFVAPFNPDSGAVEISWTVLRENAVVNYILERADGFNGSNFVLVGTTDPLGPGTFSYPDFANTGDYTYRIKVVYAGGSPDGVVLATVNSQVPATV